MLRYYRARHRRYLDLLSWRDHLGQLVNAVQDVLPDAQVYVFGSVLRGEITANSDVDVLIVSNSFEKKDRHVVAADIEDRVISPHIFEIHLIGTESVKWYRRHADELKPAKEVLTEEEQQE